MEAQREIVRTRERVYPLTLPEWAIGRDVEVIVLPLRAATVKQARSQHRGPLSALGFAKTFRPTKTTDDWMRELRAGEEA